MIENTNRRSIAIAVSVLILLMLTLSSNANATCRSMDSTNSIPKGFHPTSAKWSVADVNNDLVCIEKTGSSITTFVAWRDIQIPDRYSIVFEYPNPSTNFNGCKKWSSMQGVTKCIVMYKRYQLKK